MERLGGLDTGLFAAGERVCCAVSGGADSAAMLLALVEANGARESLGLVLSAVHVHHGLRGAEADEDEAFVRGFCARLGVPLQVEQVDVRARQTAEREGMEAAARALRYEVFWRLLAEGGADTLTTAHTQDDQAETVLMKLLRGAWTEGLGGIARELQAPAAGQEVVVAGHRGAGGRRRRVARPMLDVSRTAVEKFLRERGELWREDSSNGDTTLLRNRVRAELLPVLQGYNPQVKEVLARTAARARDDEAFWGEEVGRVLPGVVLPGRPVRGGGRAVSTAVGERALALEVERLRTLAAALRGRVVRSAARSLGCRLTAEETAKLLALAGLERLAGVTGRIGARLELRDGLRAERSARELRLSRSGASAGYHAAEDVDEP